MGQLILGKWQGWGKMTLLRIFQYIYSHIAVMRSGRLTQLSQMTYPQLLGLGVNRTLSYHVKIKLFKIHQTQIENKIERLSIGILSAFGYQHISHNKTHVSHRHIHSYVFVTNLGQPIQVWIERTSLQPSWYLDRRCNVWLQHWMFGGSIAALLLRVTSMAKCQRIVMYVQQKCNRWCNIKGRLSNHYLAHLKKIL